MGEPAPDLHVVGNPGLEPGAKVTVSWYRAGEPYRPEGSVVDPDQADLDRLRRESRENGEEPRIDERRLVHWKGVAWRRWEWARDLRVDEQ